MDEQERQEQEDHWRDLAALLGLESAAASSVQPAAKPPEKKAPVAELEPVPPPVAQFQETAEATNPIEEIEARGEYDVEQEEFTTFAEETEELAVTDDEPQEPREPAEDKQRRGRRRKGRRGRRDDRRETAPEEGGADTSVESVEEDDTESQPHGWKSSAAEAPVAETDDQDDDEAELPAQEAELDDEEDDTLSDWNVPSWTELIASLYRPER
jgi:hypothetical protein